MLQGNAKAAPGLAFHDGRHLSQRRVALLLRDAGVPQPTEAFGPFLPEQLGPGLAAVSGVLGADLPPDVR
jgi:hypothetical protein